MSINATALRLRGRRDQGNQRYRRIEQLQELEDRSGGAFKYLAYDREQALYKVRVSDGPPLYLRSADIDPFVAGVEYGVLTLGAMRAPSGSQATEWYRRTTSDPVSRVEPLHQLPDPKPTAKAHPTGEHTPSDGELVAAGELRVRWPAVPDADRYSLEVRDTSLKTPQWRATATTTEPACTVPVRTWGGHWQVRVRAEDTTQHYAVSDWAVTTATPARK